jgi:hypothetical protein
VHDDILRMVLIKVIDAGLAIAFLRKVMSVLSLRLSVMSHLIFPA